MGLLDSVLGAIGQAQGQPVPGGAQRDLLNAVIGMLGQGQAAGGLGGLAGLVDKFHQGGLGDVVNSWISTGQNLPVSADQIRQVLGPDTIGKLAQQLGLGHGDVAAQLAQALPHLVDHLTPNGQMPTGGGLGELAGALGGLFGKG